MTPLVGPRWRNLSEPDQEPRWRWDCELCGALVRGPGPWCELYCSEKNDLCQPLARKWLHDADSKGDGPMVNALCELGRRKWGPDVDW